MLLFRNANKCIFGMIMIITFFLFFLLLEFSTWMNKKDDEMRLLLIIISIYKCEWKYFWDDYDYYNNCDDNSTTGVIFLLLKQVLILVLMRINLRNVNNVSDDKGIMIKIRNDKEFMMAKWFFKEREKIVMTEWWENGDKESIRW